MKSSSKLVLHTATVASQLCLSDDLDFTFVLVFAPAYDLQELNIVQFGCKDHA